jgi:hypothetical protein
MADTSKYILLQLTFERKFSLQGGGEIALADVSAV